MSRGPYVKSCPRCPARFFTSLALYEHERACVPPKPPVVLTLAQAEPDARTGSGSLR